MKSLPHEVLSKKGQIKSSRYNSRQRDISTREVSLPNARIIDFRGSTLQPAVWSGNLPRYCPSFDRLSSRLLVLLLRRAVDLALEARGMPFIPHIHFVPQTLVAKRLLSPIRPYISSLCWVTVFLWDLLLVLGPYCFPGRFLPVPDKPLSLSFQFSSIFDLSL